MKCRIMRYFIWVFTVCKSNSFGISRIQKVKADDIFRTKTSGGIAKMYNNRILLYMVKTFKNQQANDM